MAVTTITKDNFAAEVNASPVPVLLDFWAEWCGPCRMISPIVHEIAEENTAFKVGKINIDEEPDLARSFRVMNIPTLVIVKNGKVVSTLVGLRPKAAIMEELSKI